MTSYGPLSDEQATNMTRTLANQAFLHAITPKTSATKSSTVQLTTLPVESESESFTYFDVDAGPD